MKTTQRTVELPEELNRLSERVIGCAIEVHRQLGPGLLERIYEDALCHEFDAAGLLVERQRAVPVRYKSAVLQGQRLDMVVEGSIVLELKAVECVADVHLAQLVTYLRIAALPLGLLINFNVPLLTKGVYRRINSRVLTPAPGAAHSASAPRPPRSR
jgi:GxxExxY protein